MRNLNYREGKITELLSGLKLTHQPPNSQIIKDFDSCLFQDCKLEGLIPGSMALVLVV